MLKRIFDFSDNVSSTQQVVSNLRDNILSLRVITVKKLLLNEAQNINVVALGQEALADLALDMPRSLNWSVMISDGELFVTDERGQHEIPIEWLAGER